MFINILKHNNCTLFAVLKKLYVISKCFILINKSIFAFSKEISHFVKFLKTEKMYFK